MTNGLTWSASESRWITGRERLLTLGFPVTETVAANMGTWQIPVKDVQRASLVAGNAMHFGVVAMIELTALSCYKRIRSQDT